MQKLPKIVLGIDPGTVIMGYSVIQADPNAIAVTILDVLKLPVKKDNYERLQLVYAKVLELVALYQPQELAIEAPFFGKNVQSMLKLGRAQGVAIAAAMASGIPVSEYAPRRIKQSITGNGNADKEQVWKMLMQLTGLKDKPAHYDATDALAVAVCHYFSDKTISKKGTKRKKASGSWTEYLLQNPERVVRRK